MERSRSILNENERKRTKTNEIERSRTFNFFFDFQMNVQKLNERNLNVHFRE